jgi:hypothetical protein
MHGLGVDADRSDLLTGYNAVAPGRLRFQGFPSSYL